MSVDSSVPPPPRTGWASLKDLTRYQWFVFVVCCLAWDLDCMDQQLFVLARDPALATVMQKPASDPQVGSYGTYATSVFLIGWAIGGIGFGVLGDRLGRVKTLTMTIGLYALFTGLSALSTGPWDFMAYRLLTGLGVGGAFASAVVLLAETVPNNARPYILGLFQASSVLGNCSAALINMYLGSLQKGGAFPADGWLLPWRVMFLIGILPGILLVIVQFSLREPEKWKAMREAEALGTRPSPWQAFFGTLLGIFSTSPWNKRVVCGLLLTGAGVIGLWGIAFFSPRLVQLALESTLAGEGLSGDQLKGEIGWWRGVASLVQNGGAFFGIFAFSWVTGVFGRKPTFALFFVLAMLSTAGTFWFLKTRADVFWMIPIMGFCQLALFGGYAIYLPELFPTKFRSTGTSFCYNAGRLVAALGPAALGQLTTVVFVSHGADAFRYAGVTMCSIFLVGLFVLPFLPETKGKPLPE
ncbi:Putative niacin/nicotinamide transporter NaiP [Gemmata sp. SH-PL17]|uniref:MFS transporter n=1 Tax=Gemmata sp. SH-PL17 TaxID=1630693 RepID=UPI00078DE4C3|nr:MFS transporter [Gemmata sp. SH-PL17]AMV28739.1 Putative niacin/nicotinamide transporter NaiP [Gemmata sp. SH-PL17]